MASDYGARIEFTSSLPDRLMQIRWALTQLRQRPQDTGLFAETHNSVQELACVSAAFRLDELAEIGMRVGQALVAWRSRGAPPAAWASVADGEAALAEFADRVAAIAPPAPWRLVGAGP
jgi:hypothetical protein